MEEKMMENMEEQLMKTITKMDIVLKGLWSAYNQIDEFCLDIDKDGLLNQIELVTIKEQKILEALEYSFKGYITF